MDVDAAAACSTSGIPVGVFAVSAGGVTLSLVVIDVVVNDVASGEGAMVVSDEDEDDDDDVRVVFIMLEVDSSSCKTAGLLLLKLIMSVDINRVQFCTILLLL
jgi:hypothetical protein